MRPKIPVTAPDVSDPPNPKPKSNPVSAERTKSLIADLYRGLLNINILTADEKKALAQALEKPESDAQREQMRRTVRTKLAPHD